MPRGGSFRKHQGASLRLTNGTRCLTGYRAGPGPPPPPPFASRRLQLQTKRSEEAVCGRAGGQHGIRSHTRTNAASARVPCCCAMGSALGPADFLRTYTSCWREGLDSKTGCHQTDHFDSMPARGQRKMDQTRPLLPQPNTQERRTHQGWKEVHTAKKKKKKK